MIREIREAWLSHHLLSFLDQLIINDNLERSTLYFGTFVYIISIEGINNQEVVKLLIELSVWQAQEQF